jgi:large subunit ribosomal protein L17
MLRNQATALFRHEHVTTTVPRAKELRPFVERLITIAKRGVSGGEKNGHALTARRLVMRDVQDRDIVKKLFDTIAPRFVSRPGGYTRLLRLGFRKGDSAEVAHVELIGSEFNPRAHAEAAGAEQPKPKTGMGERLRAAAQRIRGRKEPAGAEGPARKDRTGGDETKRPRGAKKKASDDEADD